MECKRILAIVAVVIIVIIITVPLVLLLPRTGQFNAKFKEECEKLKKKCEFKFNPQSQSCEEILDTFQQTYVGKDSCGFPEQDYDPLFVKIPFTHPCKETMLWSNTKELVHDFTEKSCCFSTLEDTLLGSVLNDLYWCGKNGSKETFTWFCKRCEENPVDSFWKRASAKFAEYACGEVTAMLNDENNKPYSRDSVFAIEVKKLQHPQVTRLKIVLVSKKETCECDPDLLKDLHPQIFCTCRAVTSSHIKKCIKENTPCGSCW